jgi:hypothetical protein
MVGKRVQRTCASQSIPDLLTQFIMGVVLVGGWVGGWVDGV